MRTHSASLAPAASPLSRDRPPAPALNQLPAEAEDYFDDETQSVREFSAQLAGRLKAHELADSLMPVFNKVTQTSGPIEDQVSFLLLRLLGKVENDRRRNGLERFRLERLQNGLRGDNALKQLAKVESELSAAHKNQTDDQNRATDALLNAVRILNDALLSTLRKA